VSYQQKVDERNDEWILGTGGGLGNTPGGVCGDGGYAGESFISIGFFSLLLASEERFSAVPKALFDS